MAPIREITQFSRIEYQFFKDQGRFDLPAPERNIAHARETAMRDFDALVADPKSEVNTKLGGVKNIARVRVYLVDEKFKLEFALVKPLGMIEEEKEAAEKQAKAEARKAEKVEKKGGPVKKGRGPNRPNTMAGSGSERPKFAKGRKGPRRSRQDDDDETPFKPAELTGKVVPVERVTLPQRRYH